MKWLKNLDWWLLTPLLVIFSLGALILFSLDPYFFSNQLLFFSFGVIIFFLVANFDYQIFKELHLYLYLSSILLLLLTFVLGGITRGAVRWIKIGNFSLQPSELVKPLLILSFSSLALRLNLKKIKNLLIFLLAFLLPALLIFKQPDLGNALVVFVIWLAIVFAKGLEKKYIFLGIIIFFGFLPFGWRMLKPYQQERILSFTNPNYDPLGSGYNLIQSKITVGSGQFLGKGLGSGSQSQLRFLPERQSDFIFACLGEELGFLGGTLLTFAFLALILRIFLLSQQSATSFGRLIGVGAGAMFLFQVFVNMGMNLGLMPITGLTLPLVSLGGSSLISSMILLGLVQSIARQTKRKELIEIK